MEKIVVHRTKNLKWTPTMEIALVDQVFAIGAYLKGGEENLEMKFKSLTVFLWKTVEFKNQGQPISGASLHKKFKVLLKSFRDRHGYGDDGERANISALPEESSEIDLKLEEIHNDLEEKRIAEVKKKAKEAEKKKSVGDITDIISVGGGRKRLAEMSAEKLSSSSSSSSSSTFVTPARKREKSQAQQQSDLEMVAIRESVESDVAEAKESAAALKLEREEAARGRAQLAEMSASMLEFRDEMREMFKKKRLNVDGVEPVTSSILLRCSTDELGICTLFYPNKYHETKITVTATSDIIHCHFLITFHTFSR
jgi:hypothetical protein